MSTGGNTGISEAPRFVNLPGNTDECPPGVAGQVSTYLFTMLGDHAKLQHWVDRAFNSPTGGARQYVVLSSIVGVLFNSMGTANAVLPSPDAGSGWSTVNECMFLILVGGTSPKKKQRVVDSVFVAIPYIYVNSGMAIATGRETYGYLKQSAGVEIPQRLGEPARFSVAAALAGHTTENGTREHWPSDKVTDGELLQIVRGNGGDLEVDRWIHGGAAITEAAYAALLNAVGEVMRGEHKLPAGVHVEAVRLTKELRDLFKHGGVELPVVLLKQFRQVSNPTYACYQSIVETAIAGERWGALAVLAGKFEGRITWASNQEIASTLGLKGMKVGDMFEAKVTAGFHLEQSFRVNDGNEVWRAVYPEPRVSSE